MGETRVFEGRHLLVLARDEWEYAERKRAKEAVAVLALTPDGKLILTDQYRRPVDRRVIDYPAGLVGDEDGLNDPEGTARKELEEETGYVCRSVELLARGPSSPGITSEVVSFYRAKDVEKKSKGGGVGGEDITVHTVPLGDFPDWLKERQDEGAMIDLKIWGGLYFLGLG